MAGEIPDLHAQERTGTGKGAARQARRDGLVPGIVYGGGSDPLAINIPFNILLKRLKQGRFLSTLFNLKVEGQEDVRVICRNVQRDVLKDLPTHLDLMRLRRTSKVNLFIPVEFVNEEDAPGNKKGCLLNVVLQQLVLRVTPCDIPEKLTIALAGKDIAHTLTISANTLPEGAKATIDRDFVIANISAPSGLKSAGVDDDEPEAEAPATEE